MDTSKSSSTGGVKSALATLEKTLDEYLVVKAPYTIPSNIKETIVGIAPWLAIIGSVFGAFGILASLGLGSLFFWALPFAGAQALGSLSLALIFGAVALVFEFLSIPGLMKRQQAGWRFAYYGALVGMVQNIASGQLGSFVVGILGLYIIFQVKSYYK